MSWNVTFKLSWDSNAVVACQQKVCSAAAADIIGPGPCDEPIVQYGLAAIKRLQLLGGNLIKAHDALEAIRCLPIRHEALPIHSAST